MLALQTWYKFQKNIGELRVELPASQRLDLFERLTYDHAFLYGRTCVSASNTSANAVTRAAMGIAVPASFIG